MNLFFIMVNNNNMKKILLLFLLFVIRVSALENIEINNENVMPKFSKEYKKYNYYTNKNAVRIKVLKEENEEIFGDGVHYLEDGENIIEITSSKNEKYEINIYKNYQKDNEKVYLKKLDIKGYNINFNKDKYEYNIVIGNDNSLNIDYELSNDNAYVCISGNGNFNKSDNIIKININNDSEYIIHALKTLNVSKVNNNNNIKEMSNTKKEIVIFLIITISSILVFLFYYLVFINKTIFYI